MPHSVERVEQIVAAIEADFPPKKSRRESPDMVERLMRPFAPISQEIEGKIELLLGKRKKHSLFSTVSGWLEANAVVCTPDEYPGVEARIRFLCIDTCTCVLDHLPEAIKHAKGPINPIVLALAGKGDISAQGKKVLATEIGALMAREDERFKRARGK